MIRMLHYPPVEQRIYDEAGMSAVHVSVKRQFAPFYFVAQLPPVTLIA